METVSSILERLFKTENKESLNGDILVMGLDEMFYHIGRKDIPSDYAIISFADTTSDLIDFKKYDVSNDIIRIVFPDIDYCEYDESILRSIFKDMHVLSEFIKSHMSSRFICQCYEGKSRSAAVAAVIEECKNHGRGLTYFENPKYSPNKFIYESLLREIKAL